MNRIEFDIHISSDHPAMAGHFPNRPIVPGVLLLDQVQAGLKKISGMTVQHWEQVKFLSPMTPSECAKVVCDIDDFRVEFRVNVLRNAKEAPIALGKFVTVKAVP